FLETNGLKIMRVTADTVLSGKTNQKKMVNKLIATFIKWNIKRREFWDEWTTSDAMLFGDCVIIEAQKQ
ncbi:MAG: hypothetical protein AB1348_03970, partial [Nitrospirota bacterium]